MNKFFFENGYSVNKKLLTNLTLEKFYKTIVDTAFYHLRKISDKQREIEKIYKSKKNLVLKFSEMIELYENFDKESLYQLQKLFVSNNEMRNIIVNEKFNNIFGHLWAQVGPRSVSIFVPRPCWRPDGRATSHCLWMIHGG